MQVQLTQEAKIASDFYFVGAIFAVVGFVSALSARGPKPFRIKIDSDRVYVGVG